MTTPQRTVGQAEIDRVVGNVFTNCVSYRLHQFFDPKGTGEKMRASEDLKKNLRLATQAYRLQTGQPAIQGGDLAKGVYVMAPGGKKVIDSQAGQAGSGRLRKMNPLFGTYIQVSGDIWRGIVPGTGTAGERFYDVMSAPVSFKFTKDTIGTLLAANYDVYIANGSKLADIADSEDSTATGSGLSAGSSTIYVSCAEQRFQSKEERITVIQPAVAFTKLMLERASDIAGGVGIGNESVQSIIDFGGAAASVAGFRSEMRETAEKVEGTAGKIDTEVPVYSIVFSATDPGNATSIPCQVKIKWDSGHGVGNRPDSPGGTLYSIPAIKIGDVAGILLDVMKGALTEADRETELQLDAAAIKNFAELADVGDDEGKMEMYRITITEWAEATYPPSRFPQSLPEISDLQSLISLSITENRTVPACKEFITSTIRDRRRRYFEAQLEAKKTNSALARIKALTADDVGDDRIQKYVEGVLMGQDDLKKAVLDAVATWAVKTFQGNFTESSDLTADMPDDPLLLDMDNPGLQHLSGSEVAYVLQSARGPGAVPELARACQDDIMRMRRSTRLGYFRALAPDGDFNVRFIDKPPIGRKASRRLDEFLAQTTPVPDDDLVNAYLKVFANVNKLLAEANAITVDAFNNPRKLIHLTGQRSAERNAELIRGASIAAQLTDEWLDANFAVSGTIRAELAALKSGTELLKYFDGQVDRVHGGPANEFWKWIRSRL
jgi:hypothetical protein